MAPVLLTGLSKITDQPDEVWFPFCALEIGINLIIVPLSLQDEKLHMLAYTGIGCLAKYIGYDIIA